MLREKRRNRVSKVLYRLLQCSVLLSPVDISSPFDSLVLLEMSLHSLASFVASFAVEMDASLVRGLRSIFFLSVVLLLVSPSRMRLNMEETKRA